MLHGCKTIIQQVLKNILIFSIYFIDLFQKYLDSKMFILIDETKTRYFNVEHGAVKSNKINSLLKRMTQNLLMTFFAIEKSS